jgi:DNA polymerase-3 subunit chi
MTEVRFYHLRTKRLEQALPEILTKALQGGRRIVVRAPDADAVERLNEQLWTFNADAFLPHGSKTDGFAPDQPVWLTDGDDNPNKADVLVLTGGAAGDPSGFTLCCDMFDGNDEAALAAARTRWKTYKDQGFTVAYWQQNDRGGWDKAA